MKKALFLLLILALILLPGCAGKETTMNEIPVYVFTGFLEAGKTKMIQASMEDVNPARSWSRSRGRLPSGPSWSPVPGLLRRPGRRTDLLSGR